jgi:crossover junction endodeoxyribonuclease RuvC
MRVRRGKELSYYMGIDPGTSAGGITVMDENTKIVFCEDIPSLDIGTKKKQSVINEPAIKELFLRYVIEHAFLEKAQVMPKQGVVSMGNYMMGFGILRGLCLGLGIPYTLVTPQSWKKTMMAGMGKEKKASVVRVGQLYPDISFPLVKDHNKADSILICRHGVDNLL